MKDCRMGIAVTISPAKQSRQIAVYKAVPPRHEAGVLLGNKIKGIPKITAYTLRFKIFFYGLSAGIMALPRTAAQYKHLFHGYDPAFYLYVRPPLPAASSRAAQTWADYIAE